MRISQKMGLSMSLINAEVSPAPGERVMYDSIQLQGIPSGAPRGTMIAYYLNGAFAVPSITYVENLFPAAFFRLVPIDTNGNRADYARVGDVETGDMRPEMCEQWLQDFEQTNPAYEGGGRGELYCSRSTIKAVRAGTGRYVLGVDYWLWVATGDGSLYRADGVNACQNVWARTYDQSVVYDPRWLSGAGAAA
jgi:hypothetical protein